MATAEGRGRRSFSFRARRREKRRRFLLRTFNHHHNQPSHHSFLSDMPIPFIPDDVLSEIFIHVFNPHEQKEQYDRLPTTPIKGSSSLLLVTKRFRTLSLPLFWRDLTIARPSDFITFFDPESGVLTTKGAVGKIRRGWVRKLRLLERTAIPYDSQKMAKIFEETKKLNREKEYDFHVDLTPVKLPNLHHLELNGLSWRHRNWYTNSMEPSYLDLADLAERTRLQEIDWSFYDAEFCDLIDQLGWLWNRLVTRNNEIIQSLFASSCGRLRTLKIPFGDASEAPPVFKSSPSGARGGSRRTSIASRQSLLSFRSELKFASLRGLRERKALFWS